MAGLTGWFWLIGRLPAGLLPEVLVPGRELAAPVLGLALFSVMASVLYRFDATAWQLFLAGSALAAGGLVLTLLRPPARPGRRAAIVAAIAMAAAMLMLLPKWTGGAQFFVFQGNIWDQLSYLARSVAYRAFSYDELMAADRTMPLANNFVLFARSELTERPAVSIVHAAASWLAPTPPTLNAYVFMAFLQLLSFFALAFVLVTLGTCGLAMAAVGAAALALGFFLQYVFDIDAWSELAGLPVMLLAGTSLLILLDPLRQRETPSERWRLAAAAALALAGALYLYPECVPVYLAPLALVALLAGIRRRLQALPLVAAILAAVLLTLPCWEGTMGVLFRQLHSAVTRTNDWFAYYQRYMIPLDLSDVFTAAYKSGAFPYAHLGQIALFVPIDLLSGLFGLYFLDPSPVLPLALRVLWRLVLLAGLAVLLVCALRELFACLRRGLGERRGRLALWTLLALATPLPLVLMGKLWAGGKAISMIGPFLFLLAAAPLLMPARGAASSTPRRRWRALPAALYVAAQLGFGLARPLAAAHPDGIHFASPPYPSVQVAQYKTALSWGLMPYDAELKHCRRIAVDIASPFLERYVQLHLSELAVVWWSVRPLNSYFAIGAELGTMRPQGTPDCLVTDRPGIAPSAAGGARVISLARGG
jgi:hypothetical protein